MVAERFIRPRLRLSLAALLAGACLTVLGAGTANAGTATADAGGWSVQPTPKLTEPIGELTDVSCASAGFCVSLGYPSAVWNGTSWRKEPLPGSLESVIAVSCVSAAYCMATGRGENPARGLVTKILVWNGTTWSVRPSPVVAGLGLHGLSCSSPSACLAVGTGRSGQAAARWDGRKWSLIPAPKKATDSQLLAVSCSSPSACTATGSYLVGEKTTPLIERWNGSHLVMQKATQPPAVNGSFVTGVSCPGDDGCIAIGYVAVPSSPDVPYIESWNGTAWSAMTPASAVSLTGLSCTTITSCTAVGGPTSSGPAVIEQLSGTTWSLQQAARPAGSRDSSLTAVSCVTATDCAAVGDYVTHSHATVSLGETWNGTGWTAQATPNRTAEPPGWFTGVSCSSPDTCTAIGNITATQPIATDALAETWNGSQWALTSPVPPATGATTAEGISCPAATMCMAVGRYYWNSTYGYQVPWAAAWNGTRWVKENPPRPGPHAPLGQFTAVSCASTTSCVAVGGAAAYAWDGAHWMRMRTPALSNSALYGVSCPTVTWCVAVGAHGGRWFAAAWNGTAWAVQTTPKATGLTNAVSCTSPSACTAVGRTEGHLAASRWDGTSWTTQQLGDVNNTSLTGVSCASATACTAVGWALVDVGLYTPLIESWDGTSWVQAPSPYTGYGVFASVFCPSPSSCTAAGDQGFTGEEGDVPLVATSG